MKRLLFFCLLTCLTIAHIHGQERSQLGIFDATADWGLEPEFPPLLGLYKAPGRILVHQDEKQLIYDLYGNGDDIWNHYCPG